MSKEIRLSGLATIIAAGMWILTEIMEIVNSGFTPVQLTLTLIAFVILPFGVLGFHAAQAARGGWMSLIGAVCLASSFIVWSGFTMLEMVLKAGIETNIASGSNVEKTLLGIGILLMLVGQTVLGIAVMRADLFPRWTGIILILGAALCLVSLFLQAPMIANNIIAIVICAALLRMGWTLWSRPAEPTAAS